MSQGWVVSPLYDWVLSQTPTYLNHHVPLSTSLELELQTCRKGYIAIEESTLEESNIAKGTTDPGVDCFDQ